MVLAVVAGCGGGGGIDTAISTPANLVSIEISPGSSKMALGTEVELKATGVYSDNSVRELTSTVVWSSEVTVHCLYLQCRFGDRNTVCADQLKEDRMWEQTKADLDAVFQRNNIIMVERRHNGHWSQFGSHLEFIQSFATMQNRVIRPAMINFGSYVERMGHKHYIETAERLVEGYLVSSEL
jgi:hypothetical protein